MVSWHNWGLTRLPRKPDIPSFFLFGEPLRTVEGRYLHLEDLDDRSRPNGWSIRAHAHVDLNHVFHIAAGHGVLRADTLTVVFTAPCLLMIPASVVHSFAYRPETMGSVLTIANSYLRDLTDREPGFAALFRTPMALPLDDASPVRAALASLARELNWTAPGRVAAIEAHLLTVLVDALRLIVRAKAADPVAYGPQAATVARFRELLEAHYREALTVEHYAKRLGVSGSRLRAACLKIAAASPLKLIKDRLMLEAKRALIYSNMTVSEVAYALGFTDPAYFSRFFTRAEGRSPSVFRASQSAR